MGSLRCNAVRAPLPETFISRMVFRKDKSELQRTLVHIMMCNKLQKSGSSVVVLCCNSLLWVV